jgi:hypothetical protein
MSGAGTEGETTMKKHAKFIIETDGFLCKTPLVIRDVGPWDKYRTVTYDAEFVVEDLVRRGYLPAVGHQGRRLLYFDSNGRLDEIVVEDGRFFYIKILPQEK